ncbi:MAG: efflux RND transporter periplasmic adaptor subunit [Bacteroidota bacterium]
MAVSLPLFILSCGRNGKNKKEMPMPDVQVIQVKQETVPVYSEFTGQIFGLSDIKVQSRVPGLVMSVHFKDGQKVEKGQLLYTIDDLPIRTQLDGYKADLAKSRTIMINKKSDLDRIKPLAEMKALSAHDLDGAIADYESAKSEVAISEARLADMNIQLGYTRITAPLSGIIGISNVRSGDYVGGPGSDGLNTISSTSDIKVRFTISENDYLHFIIRMKTDTAYNKQMTNLPVELILGDGSVYAEKGNLELTDRQIDPSTGVHAY